jgi:hypothetical protein
MATTRHQEISQMAHPPNALKPYNKHIPIRRFILCNKTMIVGF